MRHCGDKNFERGERYYKNGSMFEARTDKQTIKASCSGSRDMAYRVAASFKKTGIGMCRCSCPVGGGGYCKHVAALLLTWAHKPELFENMPDIEKALQSKDKKELVGLISYLLQYDSDLELVLAARLTAGANTPSNSAAYYRQVQTVFERAVYQQDSEFDISDRLSAIKTAGDELLSGGDCSRAIAVFAGMADGITYKLKVYQYYDEEGNISEVITECVHDLGTCLEHEADPGARSMAIDALMAVYVADTDFFGGIGLADEVPDLIVKLANDDEKRVVAAKLNELLQRTDRAGYDSWSHEHHKDFLDKLS
jgi:uncharacterized Zn finger protein